MDLGADIWVYPNIVPTELCKQIIERFEKDSRKAPRQNTRNIDNRYGPLLSISKLEDWKDVDGKIYTHITKVLRHHFTTYDMEWLNFWDEGYDIGVYRKETGYCALHYDGGEPTRITSCVVYLNDVEEGGETEFPFQGIRIKPSVGTIALWPPHYTHPHKAEPPVKQDRYFIVTWAHAR